MTGTARFSRHDAALLVVSLIWGANYSVSKQALGHVSPSVFAATRFVISTGLLWLVVWGLDHARPLPRRTLWMLLGLGVVGHTLNQLAFLAGLQRTTATNSAVIFGSLPVVVALLGLGLGHERPRPRVWLGILLGTAGVLLVVGAKGIHFGGETSKGDLYSVAGLLFWALFTVGLRRVAVGHNSTQVAALTHLGGTPGLIAAAAPALPGVTFTSLHPTVWVAVAYSSILSSVVASVLWTRSLKALGGARTALYNCVTPLVAGLVAWLFLGERPVPLQGLGAGLVVLGVLASRDPGPPRPE
ncbi:MAG: DMT family transporter [Gemmatimonadetes bacterium]|nr:DMT family transporter [Gemmatimonadota bacterium]